MYTVGYFIVAQMMDCVFIGVNAATVQHAHNETLSLLPSIVLSLP